MVDFEHALAAPGEFDYWRTAMPTFESKTTERAFRRGYESLRSLPRDFEARKPVYVLLNLIYYFESLYVQEQHGPDETAERAARLRNSVTETVEKLS
jgi:fructosamine-3-kinase